ncbi:hydrolase 1, exosortase A system-associated [Sphingomonas sp. ZB1N12]|uniref:hydrolase 1, exosortase A system-associated n=1 Tax=Sphingomonas arabinosi TaxID=3096160 RepID=UPI002FCB5178
MRRLIGFACEGETLAATLDEAPGTTGLLIVSGGNEIRSGAHRGIAMLAQRLAATGTPVFRYDRRGVGDSTGDNGGFLSAEPDLIAAVAAFRKAAPHVARLIGFGNCDAASTLALFGRSAGFDEVILANPWVIEPLNDLPPPPRSKPTTAQHCETHDMAPSAVRKAEHYEPYQRLVENLSNRSGKPKPASQPGPDRDRGLANRRRRHPGPRRRDRHRLRSGSRRHRPVRDDRHRLAQLHRPGSRRAGDRT